MNEFNFAVINSQTSEAFLTSGFRATADKVIGLFGGKENVSDYERKILGQWLEAGKPTNTTVYNMKGHTIRVYPVNGAN